MSWSISVKTVGGRNFGPVPSEQVGSKPKPTNFTVDLEPDDLISSLHTKIEDITGLEKDRQRLIYRGRIIGDGSSHRIKDVHGLSDGQTIHLVPKPVSNEVSSNDAPESSNTTTNGEEGSEGVVGSASAGILAALLGLGSTSTSTMNESDSNEGDSDVEAFFPVPRPRTTRASTRRRATNMHRRLASDPRHPEPAPLEPVRQSLMTLHTMIESKPQNVNESEVRKIGHLKVKRKWFKGQWLDCRDTVNQWLEATVVEIVSPKDILTSGGKRKPHGTRKEITLPTIDPAVGTEDVIGRRRLLLESAEDESDNTLARLNSDDSLVGLRERESNSNTQLLLVHYNGWPKRWDEWIRSDSERIRPFRTRSRHVSNRSHSCPSPDTAFEDAPRTHIMNENDDIDRLSLLPELHRSLNSIQDLFATSMRPDNDSFRNSTLTLDEQFDLATAVNKLQADRLTKIRDMFEASSRVGQYGGESEIDLTHLDERSQRKIKQLLQKAREGVRSENQRVQSNCQLPWMNELGDSNPTVDNRQFEKHNLEALAPLLDRLGRVLVDVAPHVAAIAESMPINNTEEKADEENEFKDAISTPSAETSTQLTTIDEVEDKSRLAETNDSTTIPVVSHENPTQNRDNSESKDESPEVDPDYVDFANGFIHTGRNGAASRTVNGRRGGHTEGFGSPLFSAFLASAATGNSADEGEDEEEGRSGVSRGGPRLVRVGGGSSGGGTGSSGGGGGIDIHIHAIVTGGGGGGSGGIAGIGLDGLGGMLAAHPNPTMVSNSTISAQPDGMSEANTPVITASNNDDDDLGLFSDLYSDNISQSSRTNTSSNEVVQENRGGGIETPSLVITSNNEDNQSLSMDELTPIPELLHDFTGTSPPDQNSLMSESSNSSQITSQSSSHPHSNRSENQQSASSSVEQRRPNSIGRLFRRVLNRRSSNNS